MLGLNRADASNEYSLRKYAPIRQRLRFVQYGMRLQRLFHFCGARLEYLEQISVTTFEVFKHVGQLLGGSIGVEPKQPCRRY